MEPEAKVVENKAPTENQSGSSGPPCFPLRRLQEKRRQWLQRHQRKQGVDGTQVYIEHQGQHRQYLRDMILGANDGLVSVLLVMIGLAGGGASPRTLLLAGFTTALAGAVSMALGEYLATKSQAEVYDGDIALEKEHFKYHRGAEVAQLRAIMQNDLLLEGDLLERVVRAIGSDDDALLKIMMAFEFGMNDNDNRSPFQAMAMSGGLFILGSLPAWIPFLFPTSGTNAIGIALALCGVGLFAIGAVKTIATRGSWVYSGCENLLIAASGAAISFAIGEAYNAIYNATNSSS